MNKILTNVIKSIKPNSDLIWGNIGVNTKISRKAYIDNPGAAYIGDNCTIDMQAYISINGELNIGNNTHIYPYAMLLTHQGKIVIGENCTIHPFCNLYGLDGNLIIGDWVRIATHTVIIPANHVFDNTEIPIRQQGLTMKGVIIRDDVWIGAGVRILDGVTIGNGVVIGAGAVVTRDIPDYSIVAGNPARIIKSRK